jgi:hypothetical protein
VRILLFDFLLLYELHREIAEPAMRKIAIYVVVPVEEKFECGNVAWERQQLIADVPINM